MAKRIGAARRVLLTTHAKPDGDGMGSALALWRALTTDDLQRMAISRKRGPVTMTTLLETFAGHDLHHLDQLRRYVEAVKGACPA